MGVGALVVVLLVLEGMGKERFDGGTLVMKVFVGALDFSRSSGSCEWR